MKCLKCGYVSFSDAEKCKKCGALLPREEAAPAAPVSVASMTLQREAPATKQDVDLPLSTQPPAQPKPAQEPQKRPRPPAGPPQQKAPEWKKELKKRVQEHRERNTPSDSPLSASVVNPAPPAFQPPSMPPGVHEPESPRSPQMAGPYDKTIEMDGSEAPRVRPPHIDRQHRPSVDQIPLFSEQASQDVFDSTEPTTGRKLAAAAFDVLIVAIPWIVALLGADRVLAIGISTILARSWLPFLLLFLALHMMYDMFFLSALSETPGMALLRMHLSGNGRLTPWKAILFSIVSFVSLAGIGTGFLWALFDPDHRSWPELAAGSRLIFKDI